MPFLYPGGSYWASGIPPLCSPGHHNLLITCSLPVLQRWLTSKPAPADQLLLGQSCESLYHPRMEKGTNRMGKTEKAVNLKKRLILKLGWCWPICTSVIPFFLLKNKDIALSRKRRFKQGDCMGWDERAPLGCPVGIQISCPAGSEEVVVIMFRREDGKPSRKYWWLPGLLGMSLNWLEQHLLANYGCLDYMCIWGKEAVFGQICWPPLVLFIQYNVDCLSNL